MSRLNPSTAAFSFHTERPPLTAAAPSACLEACAFCALDNGNEAQVIQSLAAILLHPRCLIPGFDGASCLPNQRTRYGPGSSRERPTTEAIRRAIQHSQESLRALAQRYGINQKTVAKWKKRTSVADLPTGPKEPKSTVLSLEEEAVIVAFRRHTLLPLDDCLYALQPTIPQLTRSSLHRCLQRHGISRLPEVEGEKPAKKKFKTYPIGFFHIDIAEVQTAEGKLYLFVAIDRTSKFAFVELHAKPRRRPATSCAISMKQFPTRSTSC